MTAGARPRAPWRAGRPAAVAVRVVAGVALGVALAATYVTVVVGLGALGGHHPIFPILATVLVAAGFEPARDRAYRFARRIVHGEHVSSHEVMAEFGRRLSDAVSLDDVPPRLAEAAGRGVRASASRVRVFLPGGGERTVWWPHVSDATEFDCELPVVRSGAVVGEIAVRKPAGHGLTDPDRRFLDALASQAAVAIDNVRLTLELRAGLDDVARHAAELEASGRRIATARDAERHRLEREISERVTAPLAAGADELDRARRLLTRSPRRAEALVDGARTRAAEALEALREVAHGVLPPLLRDGGIAAAVPPLAARTRLDVQVELDTAVRTSRYDLPIETAAYACCVEALRAVSTEAPDGAATIRFAATARRLTVAVTGSGLELAPCSRLCAIGLPAVADRFEALGGRLEIRPAGDGRVEFVGGLPARRRRRVTSRSR
jgi:hypothetical protein